MILPGISPDSIAAAVDAVCAGGIIGLPTETVYGLAADAQSVSAVAQVFAAKGRPADHPLIVHVASPQGVARFAHAVPGFAQAFMAHFWPGPLTLILPRRAGVAAAAAGGHDTVGVRCPDHPVALAVLRALEVRGVWGLAAPSANRFGRISPTQAVHVAQELGPDVLILDGGACEVGIESTIVDCSRERPVLLRPGQISAQALERCCGQLLALPGDMPSASPKASGTLESHYAPHAQVRLLDGSELQACLQREAGGMQAGSRGSGLAVYSRSDPRAACMGGPQNGAEAALLAWHPLPQEPDAVARELFAVLRQLDAVQGVETILVEWPGQGPAWLGVLDRLTRAAAQRS
jgi:L-threonylcarbamoyladenylate synthase